MIMEGQVPVPVKHGGSLVEGRSTVMGTFAVHSCLRKFHTMSRFIDVHHWHVVSRFLSTTNIQSSIRRGTLPIQFTSSSYLLWSLIPSWPKAPGSFREIQKPGRYLFHRMSWVLLALLLVRLLRILWLRKTRQERC